MRPLRVLTAAGTALSMLGTAHTLLNAALLRRPRSGAVSGDRPVSILVPARDEADHIADCVRALRAQDLAGPFEIIVLDDCSSDATAAVARHAGEGDVRVRVVAGAPPPPGWLGKPHACEQLARLADPGSAVLVFVDADVCLEPHAVRCAIDLLTRHDLDLVSPYPRQIAGSVTERLVQPLLQWSWLTFLPLRLAQRSRRPSLTAANGQFLVVGREAYDRAGGHGAVRGAVLDDLALLRAIKRTGGHGTVVDGTTVASCRMYSGWTELRAGYTKSLWSAFGSRGGAVAVTMALGVTYVLPPLAMLRGSRVGAMGYLAAVTGRAVSARLTRTRVVPDALAHPVSIAIYGYLAMVSCRDNRRGRLRWKGRPVQAEAH